MLNDYPCDDEDEKLNEAMRRVNHLRSRFNYTGPQELARYVPRYKDYNIAKSPIVDSTIVNLRYEADGKTHYVDILCLLNLPVYLPQAQMSSQAHKPDLVERIYKNITNPRVLVGMGILSLLNGVSFLWRSISSSNAIISGVRVLSLQVGGLIVASGYFVAYLAIKVALPRRLKLLQADLLEMDRLLQDGKFQESNDKYDAIQSEYKYLLQFDFTLRNYQQWLKIVIKEDLRYVRYAQTDYDGTYRYKKSLSYAETDCQKLISIRGIINQHYGTCVKSDYFADYDEVKPYVIQIPYHSEECRTLRDKLSKEINECIKPFINGSKETFDAFNKIEFDAFCQEAFPDLAVIYFQFDAAMTFAGKDCRGITYSVSEDERLHIGMKSLFRAHNLLKKCAPELVDQNLHYIEAFDNFRDLLPELSHYHPSRCVPVNKLTPIHDMQRDHKLRITPMPNPAPRNAKRMIPLPTFNND